MPHKNKQVHLLSILREARTIHKQRLQPFLREVGLTEDQWRVLRALHKNFDLGKKGLDAKSISQQSGIVASSLTGVLGRMERDGLLTRTKSEEDARFVVVEPTEDGLKKSLLITNVVQNYYASVELSLGEEKMNLLCTLLDELIEIGNTPSVYMREVFEKFSHSLEESN